MIFKILSKKNNKRITLIVFNKTLKNILHLELRLRMELYIMLIINKSHKFKG